MKIFKKFAPRLEFILVLGAIVAACNAFLGQEENQRREHGNLYNSPQNIGHYRNTDVNKNFGSQHMSYTNQNGQEAFSSSYSGNPNRNYRDLKDASQTGHSNRNHFTTTQQPSLLSTEYQRGRKTISGYLQTYSMSHEESSIDPGKEIVDYSKEDPDPGNTATSDEKDTVGSIDTPNRSTENTRYDNTFETNVLGSRNHVLDLQEQTDNSTEGPHHQEPPTEIPYHRENESRETWQPISPLSEKLDSSNEPSQPQLPMETQTDLVYPFQTQPPNVSSLPTAPLTNEANHSLDAAAENDSYVATTVTIVALGRSGSGISSTVRELIGPNSECGLSSSQESLKTINEYLLDIPSPDQQVTKLRILDIPGFVDGRTLEQDSQILASLKSILQNQISSAHPHFFLAISRFDDNRYDGEDSLFVRFLKRMNLFRNIFFKNITPTSENSILFLMTRLLSSTKAMQRRPQNKLNEFVRVITDFTDFPTPISILAGDNMAYSEHGVPLEGGYYKLPNKQFYPKNVWEAFISLSTNENIKEIFTSMMENRETPMKCEVKSISTDREHFDDDLEAFLYLLPLKNITIEKTEVNRIIDQVFEQLDATEQNKGIVQKTALQLRLQEENYTTRSSLPHSPSERSKFFQKNRQFPSMISASLLKTAFGVEMSEYILPLAVGYGYVLTEDELSSRTPFMSDISMPSSIGYQLPNFLNCKRLIRPEMEYFKSYSINMSQYFEERLKYLHFPRNESFKVDSFSWKVKEGFNLKPEEGDSMVSLTAVQERRILICELNQAHITLNPEFIDDIEDLTEFDKNNKESVTDLVNWFGTWGSHIVVKGYGGGRLHGSIVSGNMSEILESRTSIDNTLTSILQFLPVSHLGVPAYRFFGGESNPHSTHLNRLGPNERNELYKKWEESLNSEFIMLTNELVLEPISNLIKDKISVEKGEMVEKGIDLLLKGKLKFQRKAKGNKTGKLGTGKNSQGQRNQRNRGEQTTRNETYHDITNTDNLIGQHDNQDWSNTENSSYHLDMYSRANDTIHNSNEDRHRDFNISGFHSDPSVQLLQTQFNNTVDMIQMLKARMETNKNKNDEQYQRDLEQLNRLKENRRRLNRERKDALKQQKEDIDRLNEIYNSSLRAQQQRSQYELNQMEYQRRQVQLQNEIAEKDHQLFLEQLQRENEERAEAEKKRCSGIFGSLKCRLGL